MPTNLFTTRIFGEGLDEFSLFFSGTQNGLMAFVSSYGAWVTFVALSATTCLAMIALRQMNRWVYGPHDVVALARHMVHRARNAIGRGRPVLWGVVSDEKTQTPLPFATITVVDARGSVRATTVADSMGRYGFHSPPEHAEMFGVARIEVCKSGYYATATAPKAVISLAPCHSTIAVPYHTGIGERIASITSFFAGVIAVPLAYYATPPSIFSIAMVAIFSGSALVHALGSLPSIK